MCFKKLIICLPFRMSNQDYPLHEHLKILPYNCLKFNRNPLSSFGAYMITRKDSKCLKYIPSKISDKDYLPSDLHQRKITQRKANFRNRSKFCNSEIFFNEKKTLRLLQLLSVCLSTCICD